MKARYVHYVASVQVTAVDIRRVSGVIDADPLSTPISCHYVIQVEACEKLDLNIPDYRPDVVVEKMQVIE